MAIGVVEHTTHIRVRVITTAEPLLLPTNNGHLDCRVDGICPDLKSNDEDNTDSNTVCELALAHNHAQLHKKLGITEGPTL